MLRMIDAQCGKCGELIFDKLFNIVEGERLRHDGCGGTLEQIFLPPKRRDAQWSDKDAVVVFRTSSGEIKYPMRNDAPTPAGCERVTMRSLREVESFEKTHNVRSEMAHYDRGSGRGFDDGEPTPCTSTMSREQREAAFMRAWNGR